MKIWLALGITLLASGACDAATPAYSDFDVISVAPRNPSIRPVVMSASPRERSKQIPSPQMNALKANR